MSLRPAYLRRQVVALTSQVRRLHTTRPILAEVTDAPMTWKSGPPAPASYRVNPSTTTTSGPSVSRNPETDWQLDPSLGLFPWESSLSREEDIEDEWAVEQLDAASAEQAESSTSTFEPELVHRTDLDLPRSTGDGDVPNVFDFRLPVPVPLRVRPQRRTEVSDLPPLEPDLLPPDGSARFDWRQRSPSQTGRQLVGSRWHPELNSRRTHPEWTKLGPDMKFGPELERYRKHFEPLLKAEFEEAQRHYHARLKEWPLSKLKREGYTLPKMSTSIVRWHKASNGGLLVEFSKPGADGKTSPLPYNQFTPGSNVILSRSDPAVNPVMSNGRVFTPGNKFGLLSGSVYSATRKYVRVYFDVDVADILHGQWRIDLGLNDWSYKTQLKAIQSMNLNPIDQEVDDLIDAEVDPEEFDTVTRSAPKEETILTGTGLRDGLLRAFQEDFVPYASISSTLPVKATESASTGLIIDDGIVQPQSDLKAWDMDTLNVPLHLTPRPSGIIMQNQLIQSWTERYRKEGEVVRAEGDPDVPLNPSQIRAMAMMLSERLSLVQGPPGTGKTRVIVETIKLLKKHWQIPQPILVTAHTNVAVDNLVAGLREHGVKSLRYGPMERVRPDLLEWQFDNLAREHPLHAEIDALEQTKEALWERNADGQLIRASSNSIQLSHELNGQIYALRSRMSRDVLADADVICTTCLSAGSSFILKNIDFPMVFLDEASMATEPLSLVPLMKGSSQIAIIGDHKQLPPVIMSEEARFGGLATSLFERLIHEKHVPSIMLDTQYRMHPAISAFPSTAFYNGDLKDGTVDPEGDALPRLAPPETSFLRDAEGKLRNVMFIDHDHPESPESMSLSNYGDAEKVTDVVVDLLLQNPDLSGKDIGIIAPYAAQIRLLDSYLNSDSQRTSAIADVLGNDRAAEVGDIEIRTVDGFEGREKAIIIFSTTRCNDAGYIGFLADWRRLNVGITRAKRGLIIIGSATTLENAKIGQRAEDSLPKGGTAVWRDFIRHLRETGAVLRE